MEITEVIGQDKTFFVAPNTETACRDVSDYVTKFNNQPIYVWGILETKPEIININRNLMRDDTYNARELVRTVLIIIY